jgi:hypothetical protein
VLGNTAAVYYDDTRFDLRDYTGLTYFGNSVWTTFMGISYEDSTSDKSLIWSSRIKW